VGSVSAANPPPTLRIDDPAPPLRVMAWIKGEPVTQYEPGHVYVVEFWATWCTPCNRMMPLLSALQRKHDGRLTVIGVDASESDNTEGGAEYIKAFVNKKGDLMAYTVAMDDPVKHPVFDEWMVAGGSYGIPTTFVVNGAGKLVWVGHPIGKGEQEFNTVIEEALDGTSDLAAARATQEEVNGDAARRLKEAAMLKPLREAQKRSDYTTVVAEVDRVIAQEPEYGPRLFPDRMGALLHISEEKALAYARSKARDPASQKALSATNELQYWGAVGLVMTRQNGLSKRSYQLALSYLERLTAANPDAYWNWTFLAETHRRLGHMHRAIKAQEKAIAIAKQTGLAEDRIERLRQALASYQAGEG
jgi:thiol-disulfide isomerase/thioredoxin